jgi:hypothetical protein
MSASCPTVAGVIEPSYVRSTRAGCDAVAADYAEWVKDALAAVQQAHLPARNSRLPSNIKTVNDRG